MSFPNIASSSTGETGASPLSLTPPSGIVPGDLLLYSARNGFGNGFTLSGWNLAVSASTGTDDIVNIFWKVATGSDTFDATYSTGWCTGIAWRITDWDSNSSPKFSTQASGLSDFPEYNSFSPAGGAKDWLWIALFTNFAARYNFTAGDPPTTTDGDTFTGKIGPIANGPDASDRTCQAAWHLKKNDDNIDIQEQTLSLGGFWDTWTIAIPPHITPAKFIPIIHGRGAC